ncbi:MAG: (d)CMP kinase [Planctomycetota bacterium]|nr:(d)CMP kinase [Planctomycetota bacterium]
MTIVAIDGPAGAGKSTVARRLASDLGWAYLDSGAMYRAVTLVALEEGLPLDDAEALARLAGQLDIDLAADGTLRLGGRDITGLIRGPRVTEAVSRVASVPAVRAVMVSHQRRFAERNAGVVAEGRDIGTVVFPDADLKIYLDADAGERARRRLRQEDEVGEGADEAAVRADIEARDRQDQSREASPLRVADDAWRLDTSGMTLDEVSAAVLKRVRSAVRP